MGDSDKKEPDLAYAICTHPTHVTIKTLNGTNKIPYNEHVNALIDSINKNKIHTHLIEAFTKKQILIELQTNTESKKILLKADPSLYHENVELNLDPSYNVFLEAKIKDYNQKKYDRIKFKHKEKDNTKLITQINEIRSNFKEKEKEVFTGKNKQCYRFLRAERNGFFYSVSAFAKKHFWVIFRCGKVKDTHIDGNIYKQCYVSSSYVDMLFRQIKTNFENEGIKVTEDSIYRTFGDEKKNSRVHDSKNIPEQDKNGYKICNTPQNIDYMQKKGMSRVNTPTNPQYSSKTTPINIYNKTTPINMYNKTQNHDYNLQYANAQYARTGVENIKKNTDMIYKVNNNQHARTGAENINNDIVQNFNKAQHIKTGADSTKEDTNNLQVNKMINNANQNEYGMSSNYPHKKIKLDEDNAQQQMRSSLDKLNQIKRQIGPSIFDTQPKYKQQQENKMPIVNDQMKTKNSDNIDHLPNFTENNNAMKQNYAYNKMQNINYTQNVNHMHNANYMQNVNNVQNTNQMQNTYHTQYINRNKMQAGAHANIYNNQMNANYNRPFDPRTSVSPIIKNMYQGHGNKNASPINTNVHFDRQLPPNYVYAKNTPLPRIPTSQQQYYNQRPQQSQVNINNNYIEHKQQDIMNQNIANQHKHNQMNYNMYNQAHTKPTYRQPNMNSTYLPPPARFTHAQQMYNVHEQKYNVPNMQNHKNMRPPHAPNLHPNQNEFANKNHNYNDTMRRNNMYSNTNTNRIHQGQNDEQKMFEVPQTKMQYMQRQMNINNKSNKTINEHNKMYNNSKEYNKEQHKVQNNALNHSHTEQAQYIANNSTEFTKKIPQPNIFFEANKNVYEHKNEMTHNEMPQKKVYAQEHSKTTNSNKKEAEDPVLYDPNIFMQDNEANAQQTKKSKKDDKKRNKNVQNMPDVF